MKRFFVLLIIFALLAATFGSVTAVAFAEQNDVELKLDIEEDETEDEILAIITLTKNDGVIDLYLRVEYDTEALELVGRTFEKTLAVLKPTDNFEEGEYEPPYRVEYLDYTANVDQTGRLITLRFKVKEGAKNGKHSVKLFVRQVGFLAGDDSVDVIYNAKYGEEVNVTDDPSSTTTGGQLVAEKLVVLSDGELDSVHTPATESGEKKANEVMIGLIVGGALVLVGAIVIAYIIHRRKAAKIK